MRLTALVSAGSLLLFFSLLIGCADTQPEAQVAITLHIQNGRPVIKQASFIENSDMQLPKLQKGGSRYQIGLWEQAFKEGKKPKQLFSLPELYLQQDGELQFQLLSEIKSLQHVSLHYMDGSSGHFTLKNTQPLQLISIDP